MILVVNKTHLENGILNWRIAFMIAKWCRKAWPTVESFIPWHVGLGSIREEDTYKPGASQQEVVLRGFSFKLLPWIPALDSLDVEL